MVRVSLSEVEPQSTRTIYGRSGKRSSAAPIPFGWPPATVIATPLGIAVTEIISPLDNEVIPATDIDGMANTYGRCKEVGDACYRVQMLIRRVLWEQTEGVGKTRRLKGKERLVKLEAAADSWDQKVLKTLWEEYPSLAPQYLRIETIKPQLREVAKLHNTSGDEEFCDFRDRLLAACLGNASSTPTITIER